MCGRTSASIFGEDFLHSMLRGKAIVRDKRCEASQSIAHPEGLGPATRTATMASVVPFLGRVGSGD